MAIVTLDTRGLTCPMPILKTKKELGRMSSGDILEITASDSGTLRDFAAYCDHTGDTLLSQDETEGVYLFKIQKA